MFFILYINCRINQTIAEDIEPAWNLLQAYYILVVAYKAYMMCTNVCIVHYILIRLVYVDSSRAETKQMRSNNGNNNSNETEKSVEERIEIWVNISVSKEILSETEIEHLRILTLNLKGFPFVLLFYFYFYFV